MNEAIYIYFILYFFHNFSVHNVYFGWKSNLFSPNWSLGEGVVNLIANSCTSYEQLYLHRALIFKLFRINLAFWNFVYGLKIPLSISIFGIFSKLSFCPLFFNYLENSMSFIGCPKFSSIKNWLSVVQFRIQFYNTNL